MTARGQELVAFAERVLALRDQGSFVATSSPVRRVASLWEPW